MIFFILYINIENIEKAINEGMLYNTVSKVYVISRELPKLITNRIPQGKIRQEILKKYNIFHEINDIEYLKITNGIMMTDNINISME